MIELGMLTQEQCAQMTSDFDKPAGERCPHQRHGKGCAIYARRPFGCRMWSCRWLVNDDTSDLSRPDRSHYVIDIAPDFVTADTGEYIPVIQIWVDPNYPDAWHDDRLLAYLERRGAEGYAALIRYNAHEAQALFPPTMTNGAGWIVKPRQLAQETQHSAEDKVRVFGSMTLTLGSR